MNAPVQHLPDTSNTPLRTAAPAHFPPTPTPLSLQPLSALTPSSAPLLKGEAVSKPGTITSVASFPFPTCAPSSAPHDPTANGSHRFHPSAPFGSSKRTKLIQTRYYNTPTGTYRSHKMVDEVRDAPVPLQNLPETSTTPLRTALPAPFPLTPTSLAQQPLPSTVSSSSQRGEYAYNYPLSADNDSLSSYNYPPSA
ncbi:hypothetical protein PCANC_18745 [Puccinia coronata f. sp. avenae]|uniref:Uncharacterized protein n=1 Tax=Puccinia coronata f. sp. avenae TaxID=200324 RepID=A0A2N5SLI8_9BASI|nr:hypothetical protein PCANC_18745 [Puccinia coronata f. sp. avenae]